MARPLLGYQHGHNAVGVAVHSGLGNQLFQFAAGYALARRYGAKLYLETYYSRKPDAPRRLALDSFHLPWAECRSPAAPGALRAIARVFRPNPMSVFRQSGHTFDARFEALRPPVFLHGYFQSWRYFDGFADELRQLLNPARFASPATAALEADIETALTPVMVHVRRGDYVNYPGPARFRLLGRDYYDAARREIEDRAQDPTYFIFSDDPTAARALLADWPRARYVSGLSMFEDLLLMSRCRHFITANSTFSWWAAFLGQKADGVVAAPATWLDSSQPVIDLCPPDWLQL